MSTKTGSRTDDVASSSVTRGTLLLRDLKHAWGSRTLVMAIVNTTPDSFSGDGLADLNQAMNKIQDFLAGGADIVDIGGESSRPGHQSVAAEEEVNRVVPLITSVRAHWPRVPISIDTTKPQVLSAALSAGADMLNSVAGLTEPLYEVVKRQLVPMVITHNSRGSVDREGRITSEVIQSLQMQANRALQAGCPDSQIILDPGIGFGKNMEQNLELMRNLDDLVALGFPTMIGTSRKSFLGAITGKEVADRVFATAATVALAIRAGIDMVRVHDVSEMTDVVRVADAICRVHGVAGRCS